MMHLVKSIEKKEFLIFMPEIVSRTECAIVKFIETNYSSISIEELSRYFGYDNFYIDSNSNDATWFQKFGWGLNGNWVSIPKRNRRDLSKVELT